METADGPFTPMLSLYLPCSNIDCSVHVLFGTPAWLQAKLHSKSQEFKGLSAPRNAARRLRAQPTRQLAALRNQSVPLATQVHVMTTLVTTFESE